VSADSGPGRREVARRVFAAEFEDATYSYSEGDEERAPNYVVTPGGARINRLFAVGTLTEVEPVNEDTVRGRIADPTDVFVTYAGQYQPDEAAFLERAAPPAVVALTGKARTFRPEDSDRVFTSVRPERLSSVDADTRDRWIVTTAEATLDRLAVLELARGSDLRGDRLRAALEDGGADPATAAGVTRALDIYDTSGAYVEALRRTAVEALELVAGEREGVSRPTVDPDEGGPAAVGPLPEPGVTLGPDAGPTAAADAGPATAGGDPAGGATTATDDGAARGTADAATAGTDEGDRTTAEAGTETGDDTGTLGEFTPTGTADGAGASGETEGAERAPDDAGMYELDESEREEIEAEYDTEFSTATEVDDPGEAEIDVPDADELAEELAEPGGADDTDEDAVEAAGGEPVSAAEPGAAGDGADEGESDAGTAGEEGTAGDETAPDDADLETAVVEAMESLDDGEGADREAVVATVAEDYGVDTDAVEDAIEAALMGGRCYEPGEGTLKAI